MSTFRRFYFDDGKSRKRWHVRTRGKTQIVEYGRLGGSLRESKKLFKSPSEAAEQAEKLTAKKKREGYTEINPSRLEIVRRKGARKATEKQIKALEDKIGCALPEEYRNFLDTCNGGSPNPYCVQVPGIPHIANVGVGSLFHLQPSKPGVDELTYEYERTRVLLPEGYLPVAGESDYFTLSLNPKTFGAVFFWDHESSEVDDEDNFLESAGHLLAGSFDEFLTRIACLCGDDEEVDEGATAKSGAAEKKPRATIKRLLRLVSHDLTPKKVKEIEQSVKELSGLSGVGDGEWPFNNIDSPRVLRCLLKAGLNPEITDTEGHSLLWLCAGNRECVELLAEKGVSIDRRSGAEHETALMRAIYLEALPAVELLLQLGANPTVRLSWPARQGLESNQKLRKRIESARLKWKKSKAKKVQPRKTTAKTREAPPKKKGGPKPTIRRLLRLMKHDYLTDECDEIPVLEEVITALGDLSAIKDGEWPNIDKLESPRLVRCLLEARLNPEILDKGGKSLLCQCVSHPDCIDLVIKQGADINRRSGRRDQTALMRAITLGDKECVEFLLEAGANPTLEFDSFSQSMLELNEEIEAVIKAARERWRRSKGGRKRKKAIARRKARNK